MIVEYGRKVRNGSLPVFSVADEEEARDLLTLVCPTNLKGQYVAQELVQEQTLENLEKFSDKLALRHKLLQQHGRCRCQVRQ